MKSSAGQRLDVTLRPELTFHLTTEMRLRLEILQADILSLEDMLSLELQQNPALEVVEAEPEEGESEPQSSEEFSLEDFYPSAPSLGYSEEERPEPGSECADRSALKEHMMRAIARTFSRSEENYRIARYILDGLDEDGFLHEEPERIAQNLGVETERVEEVRRLIQLIEPVGIASRDVREALLVQLHVLGYNEESPEVRILREGFDALLQRRITSLANKLKLSTEVVARAFGTIASLDPKPGRNFQEVPCRSVQPDVALRYHEGKLRVFINESPLPPLRISAHVREILENPGRFSAQEVEFARRKLEGAQHFIKGILQRRDTLTRLAEDLLLRNYDFFSGRTTQLTRIRMQDVADALGLHISTISRAVQNKYIETPVGIFPMRTFFPKGEKNPIQAKIESIIASEDKRNPLTDAQIAQVLEKTGIRISRRTVAKYRLKLNIPDRLQRKALA